MTTPHQSNSADGEVGQATVFTYRKDGDVVWVSGVARPTSMQLVA